MPCNSYNTTLHNTTLHNTIQYNTFNVFFARFRDEDDDVDGMEASYGQIRAEEARRYVTKISYYYTSYAKKII